MIFRLLLILAAAFVLWKLARIIATYYGPRPSVKRDEEPPEFQRMTRCPQCGVHLPADETDEAGRCPQCRP